MPKFTRLLLPVLLIASANAYGQTWEDITDNVDATLVSSRDGILSDGTRLYALAGPDGSGVVVSEDGGTTFTPINTVSGVGYSLADANTLNALRFANGEVWVSGSSGDAAFNYLHRLTPGTTAWQQGSTSGFPPPAQLGSFGAIDDVVFDPVSSLYYSIAQLGGVWVSADSQSWTQRTEGFGGMGAPASLAVVDGKVFAMRPLSGGPHVTTDGGLTWTPTSPFSGVDGGRLTRTGDSLTFIVPGVSSSSVVHTTADAGASWRTRAGQPPGMSGNLSGDGQLLFTRTQTSRLLFSATGGLSWQDLPTDGLQLTFPVWPDTDYIGVQTPERIERHGDTLFILLSEIVNSSFSTVTKLYRLDLAGFDWRPETVIVDQPSSKGNFVGGSVTLEVFAVGDNLTYQWFHGETELPGATGPTLVLSDLAVDAAGAHYVVVTGDRGVATSQTANVEVRAERIDGEFDLTYDPEVTDGGQLHLLADGTILRVRGSAPSWIARMDVDGNALGMRGLSAGLPSQQAFYPQFHLVDEDGRLIVAGYTGSNTSTNQRLRRFDPITLEDDPTFPLFGGFDSNINGLAELPGRGYLVSGQFNNIGGVPVSRVALVRYDGTLDPDYAVGMPLTPHGLIGGVDGTAYIWGNFGGTPYLRLVRLDRRGQIMPDFPAFTDIVEFMDRLSDGRIVVVTSWNSNRTLQILLPDGTPDPVYTSVGTFNDRIFAVALQPDGKLIVTGQFTQFAGQSARGHIRLLPTGARDPDYHATTSFTGDIFFSLNINSALYLPGYVFLVNSGDAGAFQGYAGLGRGPVRVFAQEPDLAILRQSLSRQVLAGESVTLSIHAHGSTAVSYQWFLDGEEIPGATAATLSLADLNATQTGVYTVRLVNDSGTIFSQPIRISLFGAPELLVAPAAADLLTGENHTLTVEVDGATPITYQWRLNGEDIPGADGPSLTLTNVQPGEAGFYSVSVSNAFGHFTTAPVEITVNTVTGVRITTFQANATSGQVDQVLRRPDGVLVVRGSFTTIGGASTNRFAFLDPETGVQVPGLNHGGFNSNVNGIAVQPDGKVIVGGQFTNVFNSGRNRLVRLNLDGTVDTTFNVGGVGPSATVTALWTLADGRIIVNVGSGTYNGVNLGTLFRLLPDGTPDPTWVGGSGPNSAVYTVLEGPGDVLYVGGAFGAMHGTINPNFVRLLPDGTLDATYNTTRAAFDYFVRALALQPDGKLLVGGEFNNVGGSNPAYRKIARLHPNGTLDTSFTAHSTVNTLQHVYALQLLPGGKILLGGTFQSWPGIGSNIAGQRLVMLRPDGSVDPFFRPGNTNSHVHTLLAMPDGRAYVGGAFTTLAGGSGTSANRLGILTIDATDLAILRQPAPVVADLDGTAEFSVKIYADGAVTYQWFHDGELLPGATSDTLTLTGLTRENDGHYTVLVTNTDTGSEEMSLSARLIVLAEPVILSPPAAVTVAPGGSATFVVEAIGAGELNYQWFHDDEIVPGATGATLVISAASATNAGFYHVVVTNTLGDATSASVALSVVQPVNDLDPMAPEGTGPNNTVRAVAELSDGRIAIGGDFTRVNGNTNVRNRFAVLEADGTLVSFATNPSYTSQVFAIAPMADGRFFVGWNQGFERRLADGTLDPTFPVQPNAVRVFRLDDTHVYVGGFFGSSGGLRRYSLTNGEEDTAFSANTGPAGFAAITVLDLIFTADGKMLAAGGNGIIRRLNPDGTADPGFNPPTFGSSNLYAIAETTDGRIWVGGDFTVVGGISQRHLTRLNADGTHAPIANTLNSGYAGAVYRLFAQGDDVLVGGQVTYVTGGVTRAGLLRYSGTTGDLDTTFPPLFTQNNVHNLATDAAGNLLVAGSFTSPRIRVARAQLTYDGEFAIVGQPRSLTVAPGNRAAFSVAWVGGGAPAYQWFHNNDPIPGATGQELVIPAATETDAGNYHVTVTVGTTNLTSAPATLTVGEDGGEDPEPVSFEAWSALAILPADQRGPLDNPSGDGLSNLLKFALDLDPATPSGSALVTGETQIGNENYQVIGFTRRTNLGNVTVVVEVSTELDFSDELGSEIVSVTDNGDGTETVIVRSAVPISAHDRQFMRLRASLTN